MPESWSGKGYRDPSTHRTSHSSVFFCSTSTLSTPLILTMSYFNNNSFGTNFSYYSSEDQSLDGYPFVGYDQPIPDSNSAQDWYLHTSSEGHDNQSGYQGYSVLDNAGCQFANPYALSTDHTHNSATSESRY